LQRAEVAEPRKPGGETGEGEEEQRAARSSFLSVKPLSDPIPLKIQFPIGRKPVRCVKSQRRRPQKLAIGTRKIRRRGDWILQGLGREGVSTPPSDRMVSNLDMTPSQRPRVTFFHLLLRNSPRKPDHGSDY
jgi:hypothetical protein